MTLKRTINLLKEYLTMNNLNVIELTNVNKYRLQSVTKIIETHYIFIKKSTKRH